MKALIKSMENNDKGANVGRQSAEETIADVPGLIPAGEDGREEDNIFNVYVFDPQFKPIHFSPFLVFSRAVVFILFSCLVSSNLS